MRMIPVWAVVIGFVTVIAGFIVLTVLNRDTMPFVTFVAFLLAGGGAAVPGVAAWRNTQVIKEQTNGPLQATHSRVESLETTVDSISQRLSDKGV